MAGPTANIIFQQALTGFKVDEIRADIATKAEHVEGDDFWIQKRPFLLRIGPGSSEELGDYITENVPEILGWVPEDKIGLAAMCNDRVDHRLLGELCLNIAALFDGIIDFGGELPQAVLSGPGSLYTIPYKAAAGRQGRYNMADAQFMKWWLEQSEFQMVK